MKQSIDKFVKPSRLVFFIYVVIGGFLSGCTPISSDDVSGTYQRARHGVVDTIILYTNLTFHQSITFTNGPPWTKNGAWKLNNEIVEFDTFYSAFEVDTLSHKAFVVIPPKPYSMEFLWVEKGKLLKDSEQPFWIKLTLVK